MVNRLTGRSRRTANVRRDEGLSRRRTTKSSTLQIRAKANGVKLVSVVPVADHVREDLRKADQVLKAASVGIHDATTTSNRAGRRAVSVGHFVATMNKETRREVRAATHAAAGVGTAKAALAAKQDTDKEERGIDADTRKTKGRISKAATRLVRRTVVKEEPEEIGVRLVVIKMTKRSKPLNRSSPTMTLAEDVVVL